MQEKTFAQSNFKHLHGALVFLGITLALASCRGVFYSTHRHYGKALEGQPYDAIIVPGVPFENGNWSYTMKGRVIWSVYLYRQGYTKNIIYSGSAVYSPYVEGKIMALYAEKLGVDPKHIYVDCQAEHSTENVYYSCLIARKHGFQEVALATDRFQSRTLADYLPKVRRKLGVDVKSLPMQEELMKTMPHDDPVIDFRQAYVDNFISLVDRESKFQRLKGTLGKNIRYEKEPAVAVESLKNCFTY